MRILLRSLVASLISILCAVSLVLAAGTVTDFLLIGSGDSPPDGAISFDVEGEGLIEFRGTGIIANEAFSIQFDEYPSEESEGFDPALRIGLGNSDNELRLRNEYEGSLRFDLFGRKTEIEMTDYLSLTINARTPENPGGSGLSLGPPLDDERANDYQADDTVSNAHAMLWSSTNDAALMSVDVLTIEGEGESGVFVEAEAAVVCRQGGSIQLFGSEIAASVDQVSALFLGDLESSISPNGSVDSPLSGTYFLGASTGGGNAVLASISKNVEDPEGEQNPEEYTLETHSAVICTPNGDVIVQLGDS